MAPFDVRFPQQDEKEEEIKTVLQPDISVICDPAKLDEKGCLGSPDLIMEIVSQPTVRKDMREKLFIYENLALKSTGSSILWIKYLWSLNCFLVISTADPKSFLPWTR